MAEGMPNELNRLVYLERMPLFGGGRLVRGKDGQKVIRLRELQRAVGVLEGKLLAFDEATMIAEVDIAGTYYKILNTKAKRKEQPLTRLVGQQIRFSFWPSLDKTPSARVRKAPAITMLKLSRLHKKLGDKGGTGRCGQVEIIGKLERLLKNGLLLAIWSVTRKQVFYIPVVGEYPYPDEVGKYVWVVGQFDSQEGVIQFMESGEIAFVSEEEMNALFPRENKKTGRPQKKKGSKPKDRGFNKFTPDVPIVEVAVDKIELSSKQKGAVMNVERFEELKDLYKRLGRSPEPIVVYGLAGGKYLLQNGLRRLKAAQVLGYEKIAAYVIENKDRALSESSHLAQSPGV